MKGFCILLLLALFCISAIGCDATPDASDTSTTTRKAAPRPRAVPQAATRVRATAPTAPTAATVAEPHSRVIDAIAQVEAEKKAASASEALTAAATGEVLKGFWTSIDGQNKDVRQKVYDKKTAVDGAITLYVATLPADDVKLLAKPASGLSQAEMDRVMQIGNGIAKASVAVVRPVEKTPEKPKTGPSGGPLE